MRDLEPPDTHFLAAAAGWLDLGLPDEVPRELARLSPDSRSHPDVLTFEWEFLARAARWPEALAVATQLLQTDQSRPTGWINRSYALHELRRTAEARDELLAALRRFPTIGVIPYNLACYACQLGNLQEARDWLRRAMEQDGRDIVIQRARQDLDLVPLLPELDLL